MAGRESGERDQFGVAGVGVAGELQRTLVIGEGVGVATEAVPHGAQRVERAGLDRKAPGPDSERGRVGGHFQRAGMVAEVQPDSGEDAHRLRLRAPVTNLAMQSQRPNDEGVGVVEPAESVVGASARLARAIASF